MDIHGINEAIEIFTRTIELSHGGARLQAAALMMRSYAKSLLGRFDDAYADAKAAEALDSTELFSILLVEGVALSTHEKREDLLRSARLLAVVSEMKPPPDLASGTELALENLSEVYYKLGQFPESRQAALRALSSSPAYTAGQLYQIISISYLRSGDYQPALATATEYASRAMGTFAQRWLGLVKEYPESPMQSLDALEAMRQPLSISREGLLRSENQ
jgi:tetratricopeptide (TPR) repeat protein